MTRLKTLLDDRKIPLIMGVVNVTPGSFSDDGSWLDPEAAIAHERALIVAGADVLDIGDESTRPGAEPVMEAEEIQRIIPVIESLARIGNAVISVDSFKPAVAQAAIEAGAKI